MIRNIYSDKVINKVESFHSPVSLTIPDDALSVKELFERYQTGALERSRAQLQRQLEYQGINPDFDEYDGSEDLIDKYESLPDLTVQKDVAASAPTEGGENTDADAKNGTESESTDLSTDSKA